MRRLLLPVLAVAMAVTGWAHGAGADESTTTVLVHLAGPQGSGSLERVLGEMDDADALPEAVDAYDTFPWAAVEVDHDGLAVLERSASVLDVAPARTHTIALDQAVPNVKADQVTAAGFDGAGQAVAVLDTGVQTDHPFLAGRTVAEACFSHNATCPGNVTSSSAAGSGQPCTFSVAVAGSSCQHGTHVAGIALGKRPTGDPSAPSQGVAPGASLIAVQVFSGTSGGGATARDDDILAGLDWVNQRALSLHVAAVNLSLGGDLVTGACDGFGSNNFYVSAFGALRLNGVAPVVAAGNNGSGSALTGPACISNAISVSATRDSTDHLASYSNTAAFSAAWSLSAPGDGVYSSIPGSTYGTKSGTSMATPVVAGAFAALKQAVPTATVAQLLTSLQSTGVPVTLR
ncbi:MAG: apr 1, partial [Actinomycetia bacterium]|nr:apr 1 [Actinomycetes bacterium]